MPSRPVTVGGLRRHLLHLVAAAFVAAALFTFSHAPVAAASPMAVATEGECLRLRAEPSISATILSCLAFGSVVDAHADTAEADGYSWRHVTASGRTGWVASDFLRPHTPSPEAPVALVAPPPGGLTIGRAGTTAIDALVAAQPFEVSTVAVFDVTTQRFRLHNAALAARFSSLPPFEVRPDDVVLVRRAGVLEDSPAVTASSATTAGATPTAHPTPPRGGLTVGVSGTADLGQLIATQPFAVDLVTMWDVEGQRWLMHRPDAPAFTSSLREGALASGTPVFLRRHLTAPDPEPPPPAPPPPVTEPQTEPRTERITYYFCERGEIPAGWDDGGGFCGAMANGQIVHEGAASCARHRMGEQFLIVGDPTERIYTCTDTGGAVYDGHRDIWFANSDEARLWWLEVGSTAVVITLD